MASPNLPGALTVDYRGTRHALGRTADGYAIWSLEGGPPIRTFPLSNEGWAEGWRAYEELEGRTAVSQAAERTPLGTGTWTRGRPIPLQPMRVGQILDAAFKLYRLHFATLIPIVALVMVPVTFLQNVFFRQTFAPLAEQAERGVVRPEDMDRIIGAFVAGFGIGVGVYVVVMAFLTAALVRVAAEAYLGREVTVGGVLRVALSRMIPVLWVLFLTFLAVLAVFVPVVAAMFASALADGAVLLVVLLVLAAIPTAIFVYLRLVFAPSVLMVEDARGTGALRRSWRLARRVGWKILGTVLLVGILAAVISAVVSVPFQVVADLAGGLTGPRWYLYPIGQSLGSVLTTPFSTLAVVLLYFDARIRKEGFDLALMAQELGTAPPAGA